MVYIELLFLEDLVYNYVILLITSIILFRIASIKRLIISSMLGSTSLVIFNYNVQGIYVIIILILFSFVMSIVAFSYKDIIYTLKNVFYMYISSIFIAGFIYLLNIHLFSHINNNIFKITALILISPIITIIYLKSINKLKNTYSND